MTKAMLSKIDVKNTMVELKNKAPMLQPGVRVLTIGLDKVAPRHNGRLCTILD